MAVKIFFCTPDGKTWEPTLRNPDKEYTFEEVVKEFEELSEDLGNSEGGGSVMAVVTPKGEGKIIGANDCFRNSYFYIVDDNKEVAE